VNHRKPQTENQERLTSEWPFFMALILMGLVIFFYRLGAPGLMDPDEGRYAEIAREILVLKDWLIPHLNLFPYLEKPPLVYWLTALSFKVLGRNELAARLPSALSALGGLFLAYSLGRALWGTVTGFIGATVLATCCGYVVMGRILTLDMTFSLLLNLAIALGYLALSRERRDLWLWAYGVLALAVLAKGPVALVLAGLIWGLWVLFQRRPWKSLIRPRSWLLLAVLTLPWFGYLQWHFPQYFRFFILEQHFGRFLSAAIHPEPFYYFIPVLLGLFLPWSFLLPWALFSRSEGRDPDRTFLLIWAGVVLIFFSLSRGKLPTYILPALLPLALLLGRRLHELMSRGWSWQENLLRDLGFGINLLGWGIMGLLMLIFLLWQPAFLSKAISRSDLPIPYLYLVGAIFVLTPALSMFRRRLSFLFLGALLLSALVPVGLDRVSLRRSPRELGRIVRSLWQPGDALAGAYLYSQGLSFYSGQVFHLLDSKTELDFGRRLDPERNRKLYFGSISDLARLAGSRNKVFLYIKEQHLEGLKPELPGKIRPLGRLGDCLLVVYERE
jgi:4-amino-4-deoxy-L-arabinose transferase-like glycosyltransferase